MNHQFITAAVMARDMTQEYLNEGNLVEAEKCIDRCAWYLERFELLSRPDTMPAIAVKIVDIECAIQVIKKSPELPEYLDDIKAITSQLEMLILQGKGKAA